MAGIDEGGIVFFRTEAQDEVIEFYTDRLGASVVVEQPDCTIVDRAGFRLGFCAREGAETQGTITFVVPDRAAVDEVFEALEDRARGPPEYSDTYEIYQFFAEDPEGRTVEVQCFE
jgi:catechol 2,3-dioxygenase-like lactoylglutathione lyase family enzyme